jgi:PhnB protein
MRALNITILFNGQAEAAFNFYKSVFGGEFVNFQRMKDIPGAPEMPAATAQQMLHVALPVKNIILMGMDVPEVRPPAVIGTNFMVTIDTESEEETTTLFNGLAAGGNVMMPLAKQFWSDYFGMVTDKFGIQWMIGYTKQ